MKKHKSELDDVTIVGKLELYEDPETGSDLVAVCTDDGEEYVVTNKKMVRKLMKYTEDDIDIEFTGTIREDPYSLIQVLTIEDYKLLQEFVELKSIDNGNDVAVKGKKSHSQQDFDNFVDRDADTLDDNFSLDDLELDNEDFGDDEAFDLDADALEDPADDDETIVDNALIVDTVFPGDENNEEEPFDVEDAETGELDEEEAERLKKEASALLSSVMTATDAAAPEKPQKTTKAKKTAKAEQEEKPEKPVKAAKTTKKAAKPAKAELEEKPEKPEKVAKTTRKKAEKPAADATAETVEPAKTTKRKTKPKA